MSGTIIFWLVGLLLPSVPRSFGLPVGSGDTSTTYLEDSGEFTRVGRFLHVTDLHLDLLYRVNSTVKSSCHHDEHVVVSPDQDEVSVGKWGAPLTPCDAPKLLLDTAFAFLNQSLIQDGGETMDFVVWTGDNARHDSDKKTRRTWEEIKSLNQYVSQYFFDSFGYNQILDNNQTVHNEMVLMKPIPVIPSIGNNDVYPHNQIPYTPNKPNTILDFYSELWEPFIPDSEIDTFRIGGYFAYRDVTPGLTVVSLNTMLWFQNNLAEGVGDCFNQSTGGAAQFLWLESVLEESRQNRKKVILSGHIPPIERYYYDGCVRRYVSLMDAYIDTVEVGLFGHTHADSFSFATNSNPLKAHKKPKKSKKEHKKHHKASKSPDIQTKFDANVEGILGWLSAFFRQPKAAPWMQAFAKSHFNNYKMFTQEIDSEIRKARAHLLLIAPSLVSEYNPSLRVFFFSKANNHTEQYQNLRFYRQYFLNLREWYRLHPEDYSANHDPSPSAPAPNFGIEYDSNDGYSSDYGALDTRKNFVSYYLDVASKVFLGSVNTGTENPYSAHFMTWLDRLCVGTGLSIY